MLWRDEDFLRFWLNFLLINLAKFFCFWILSFSAFNSFYFSSNWWTSCSLLKLTICWCFKVVGMLTSWLSMRAGELAFCFKEFFLWAEVEVSLLGTDLWQERLNYTGWVGLHSAFLFSSDSVNYLCSSLKSGTSLTFTGLGTAKPS